MSYLRIIAAVLDTERLTLYKEDGETVTIPQGDSRIKGILDTAIPAIRDHGVATVSLDQTNDYAAFEKKAGGLVRLFRVAKKAVQHLLGSEEERQAAHLAPTQVGQVPGKKPDQLEAIGQIMANATSVSSSSYRESDTTSEHTMVAVTGTGAETRVVPGVEALKTQFAHSAKLGSTEGVSNLIARLGKTIERRGHSVQDVLRFLEKGDLPVADDGTIIAYKMLNRHPQLKDTFVDCHTGRIPQKVGSYVCVDESLVDRNRRNECSNGLHIARRGYLGSFNGDVCVLTKIAPEDVVTVPHGDPNKVRVCGYHIIGLIPASEVSLLKLNKPMTESSECQRLLGQAISGRHVARLEEVRVTEQQGGGVKTTPLIGGPAPQPKLATTPTAVALDDTSIKIGSVDPKAVIKQMDEAKPVPKAQPAPVKPAEAPQKAVATGSRLKLAQDLAARAANGDLSLAEQQDAAQQLLTLKKTKKVSWTTLGLSDLVGEKLQQIVDLKPEPTKKETTKVEPTTNQPAKDKPATAPNRVEIARQLFDRACADKRQWGSLWLHKRKAKYSWAALGFSPKEIERIEINKPDFI